MFGLQLPELLARAQELHVRVDFWAFPGYTKITLLRQHTPGKGSWQQVTGWTFRGMNSAEALERALLYLETRIQNWEAARAIYQEWEAYAQPRWVENRGAGRNSDWGVCPFREFEMTQAHRYIIIPEPEGASS